MSNFSIITLYQHLHSLWFCDLMRSPLLHPLLSQHSIPNYAGGFFEVVSRFFTSSMAFIIPTEIRLPLVPIAWWFYRRFYGFTFVTDCWFDHYTLQHTKSPLCTGGGLLGDLALTMIELSSISKRVPLQGTRKGKTAARGRRKV